MSGKQCECGCGEDAQLRKGSSSSSYRRFIEGHAGKVGDRLKAQKALGHLIPKGVEVHHHSIVEDDGFFKDTSQLVICENHKYHCYLHMRQRAFYGVPVFRYDRV